MGLLNRKKKLQLPTDTRVEVTVDDTATEQAYQAAKDASDNLNRLLVENGFTLKLYLAAGGKNKHK